jgi:ABC-type glutathione transport system ATPase component
MQVRLAFSIAVQAQADILLVDEVLAVGDAAFQQKCFEVFRRLKKEGKTVIFVSHALEIVQEFCDRVALINKGKLLSVDNSRRVINDYFNLVTDKEAEGMKKITNEDKNKEDRWGDGKVKVIETQVETLNGNEVVAVRDNSMNIRVRYEFLEDISEPVFGLIIRNSSKQDVIVTNTKIENVQTGNFKKDSTIDVLFSMSNVLEAGDYTISPAVADKRAEKFHDWRNNFKHFLVARRERTGGIIYSSIKINIGKAL